MRTQQVCAARLVRWQIVNPRRNYNVGVFTWLSTSEAATSSATLLSQGASSSEDAHYRKTYRKNALYAPLENPRDLRRDVRMSAYKLCAFALSGREPFYRRLFFLTHRARVHIHRPRGARGGGGWGGGRSRRAEEESSHRARNRHRAGIFNIDTYRHDVAGICDKNRRARVINYAKADGSRREEPWGVG